MKRLVLLGGGHSHVEVLRRFGTDPLTGTELVLVSPFPDSPYSGMLPGWIAGHYTRDECHIDLMRLTRFANCRFARSGCNGINPEARLVFCEDGTTLPYDIVSVDTGTRSPAFDTPGAPEHALPVKPVEHFSPVWDEICKRAVRGQAPRRIAVVGGGAAGVEVLLAMQYRLRRLAPLAEFSFELVSDTGSILATHNIKVRTIFTRVLERRGVTQHLGRAVERMDRCRLRLRGGASIHEPDPDAADWLVLCRHHDRGTGARRMAVAGARRAGTTNFEGYLCWPDPRGCQRTQAQQCSVRAFSVRDVRHVAVGLAR